MGEKAKGMRQSKSRSRGREGIKREVVPLGAIVEVLDESSWAQLPRAGLSLGRGEIGLHLCLTKLGTQSRQEQWVWDSAGAWLVATSLSRGQEQRTAAVSAYPSHTPSSAHSTHA